MQDTDVIVRPAEVKDIDALVELLQILFAIEADFVCDPAKQQRGLELMLAGCRKHRCIMVAEAHDQVVGMCSAQSLVSTAEGAIVALVEDMVVKEGWRGKKIGTKLLSAVEKWAQKIGAARIQLLADRNNSVALEFYQKRNWSKTQLICLRKK